MILEPVAPGRPAPRSERARPDDRDGDAPRWSSLDRHASRDGVDHRSADGRFSISRDDGGPADWDDPNGPNPGGAVANLDPDERDLIAAQRQIAFQAHLLDSVGDAVVACELNGRVRYFNPAAAILLGWVDASLDRSVFDILSEADQPHARLLRDEVLRNGVSVNEVAVKRGDGPPWSALLKGSLVRDEHGEPSGIIAVIIDIEDRRKAEEQAKRRAAEQTAAARLSETALRDTPLRDLLDDATRTLAEILGVDHTSVLLFDDEQPDQLRLVSASGRPKQDIGQVQISVMGSIEGRALTQRVPTICHADIDASRYPESKALFDAGVKSSMVGVIEGSNHAYGVLGAHANTDHVFTRDDELFVQTLGNVIAAAIMRERAEAALIEAEEAERRRIAEAVHDDTLQVMIAVALRLETLQRNSDDEVLHAKIGQLVQDTRMAAGRLRSLAFDLYPEDLAQGLEKVVHRLLEDTAGDAGFEFTLTVDLPKAPPILAARTIYRNAAEAIMNVRKHARASHVDVRIFSDDEGTEVRISDDGVGIPVVAARGGAPGHLGLKGLRERTTRAGGRSKIESGISGGTVVELWVPSSPPQLLR